MVYLTVMYNPPADPAAFIDYYYATHVPLVKKMPGLRSFLVTEGPITNPDGSASPYALIAHLIFDDAAALRASTGSPEGRTAGADTANFATGGVKMYVYETREL
jgi:uncharacterized protein (TIGR02118 family)